MSRAHEEHVAELTVDYVDAHRQKTDKVKKNVYFQRLQNSIKRKKIPIIQKGLAAQTRSFNPKKMIKPKFKWAKDIKGELYITARPKPQSFTPHKIEKGASHIVKFLGYKIDLSSQVDTLMEKYQKYYIDTKSHNILLAKFAQLKTGMLVGVLTLLGVSSDTLTTIRRDALDSAIEENKLLFAQNEYNIELMTLFNAGKDHGRLAVLQELTKQLTKQMKRLGKPDYYSKVNILEIKKKEVHKIVQDLIEEKQNLEFIADYSR